MMLVLVRPHAAGENASIPSDVFVSAEIIVQMSGRWGKKEAAQSEVWLMTISLKDPWQKSDRRRSDG